MTSTLAATSAAMQTNQPWHLNELEPGTQDAARQAARRAGMTLEEWVADVVAAEADRVAAESTPRQRRQGRSPGPAGSSPAAEGPGRAAPARIASRTAQDRSPESRTLQDRIGPPPAEAAPPAQSLEAMLARLSAEADRRAAEHASKTAVALNSVARWIERAEDRMNDVSRQAAAGQHQAGMLDEALGLMTQRLDEIERVESRLGETSRLAIEGQERAAGVLGEALGRMTRRLDEIEQKIEAGDRTSVQAALEAVGRIEGQMARLADERAGAGGAGIEAALKAFEARIAQITERLVLARPIGRRGASAADEVRDAVGEIRSRQQELDAAPRPGEDGRPPARSQGDILTSLRGDIARLAGQLETLRPASDAADRTVAAVRAEIARMQGSIGRLATRNEVAALERSVHSLGEQVAGGGPADASALRTTLEGLQDQVRHLSEAVSAGGAGRISQDVDALAHKIDLVAESGVDPSVADMLSREIGEIRRVLGEIADPRRIERLQEDLATLNGRVAEIGARQVDSQAFERLRDAVEGIRAEEFGARLESLGDRIDRLGREPQAGVLSELQRLSSKVEGALAAKGGGVGGSAVIEPVIERIDQLEGRLREPAHGAELKSIEEMLRQLAARLESADRPGADLDALERQVESIAARLDRAGGVDPKLAALERSMTDLMAQVGTMRDDAFEAVERATRTAIADSLKTMPEAGGEDLGGLRRDVAELKAHYSAADKRTHATLETVHTALERLVARLESLEQDLGRERQAPPRSERPAAPAREAAPAAPKVSPPRAPRPSAEVLLEPGAGRPAHEGGSAPERAEAAPAVGADSLDVKAGFIAAARRAAQAAAAEAASAKGAASAPKGRGAGRLGVADGTGERVGLAARMRKTIDRRRRPILLGLAAVVLALGAFQVASLLKGEPPASVAAAPRAEPSRAEPSAPAAVPAAPLPAAAEPRTTQAIAPEPALPPAPPPEAGTRADLVSPAATGSITPAAAAGPARTASGDRIAGIASLDLPASLVPAALRQAALAGDPGAVYELASRLADGRGVARDPKLAAKLFEKAAAHGIVPAQYRIGNHYEKGLGVARDLAAAKTWYQRAAEKGNARAMHNLAVLLAEGAGGRPDYAAAVDWFRKAAEHGIRDSQYNLAVLLARGLGTAQDLSQSYQWFALAAAQGDDDAAKKRDEIAGRLPSADLAAAKKVTERWKPRTLDAAANEVALPPSEWTEAPRRPAASGRG